MGESFVLPVGELLTVGRSSKAMVSVGDGIYMSSLHFAVEYRDGVVQLRDQGSTNKTGVNNEVVYNVSLREGDMIRTGRTEFCLEQVRQETEMGRPVTDFSESSQNNFIEPSDVEPIGSWFGTAADIDIPITPVSDVLRNEAVVQSVPIEMRADCSNIESQFDFAVPRIKSKAPVAGRA